MTLLPLNVVIMNSGGNKMKAKKLLQLIATHCPKVSAVHEWDNRVKITLPDGGEISTGIDPPNRVCKFPFLWFNVRGSAIRLNGQDEYSGKLNYFQHDAEYRLVELLKELNERITT